MRSSSLVYVERHSENLWISQSGIHNLKGSVIPKLHSAGGQERDRTVVCANDVFGYAHVMHAVNVV